MKVTLKTLLELSNKGGVAALDKAKLDVKTKWNLGKFNKTMMSELEDYQKTRTEMIKKYGVINDDSTFKIKPENVDTFNEEVETLMAVEVEIHTISLPLSGFEEVPVSVVAQWEAFIVEGPDLPAPKQ